MNNIKIEKPILSHNDKCKLYRSLHPELIQKINKRYYDKHKVQIIDYLKKEVHCDACGTDMMRSNLSKHKKTKKHQNKEIELTLRKIKNREILNHWEEWKKDSKPVPQPYFIKDGIGFHYF